MEHPDGRPCYAVDGPGHGHSDWQEKYSFQSDAEALVAFLSDVSGPAVVVGHSRGGLTACLAAVLEPGLFRGLYLEDVTPIFWREAPGRPLPFLGSVFALRGISKRATKEGLDAAAGAREISRLGHDVSRTFGDVLTAESVKQWAEAVAQMDPDVLGSKADFSPPEASPETIVSGIDCAVHVAHGDVETGSAVTPEELEWFAATARHASATSFPGLGHFLRAARPSELADDLATFLRKCP
jgi:pimeloyl-ACP methyl ester carboxylesterase